MRSSSQIWWRKHIRPGQPPPDLVRHELIATYKIRHSSIWYRIPNPESRIYYHNMNGDIRFRSLILTGGRSTRMGFPKHLLRFSDQGSEVTLLEILLQIHKEIESHTAMGLSCIPPVFISVGDERQQSAMLDVLDRKARSSPPSSLASQG